jgi:hypothetical protein
VIVFVTGRRRLPEAVHAARPERADGHAAASAA